MKKTFIPTTFLFTIVLCLLIVFVSCKENTPFDSAQLSNIESSSENQEAGENEQVGSEVSADASSEELTDNSETGAVVSDTSSKPSGSPGDTSSEVTSSKPAKEETSSKSDEVHKHSYVKKVVKPTCTKDGYTKYTCDCGKTYKDKETEKLGHDYTEWKTTKKATTKSEGVKTRTCERCGITKNKNIPKKESSANVDSKIEVDTRFGTTQYRLKDAIVLDRRTWGEAPAITIGDDDSLRVTYCNKKGEKVQFTVPQPANKDIIIRFTIRDDGTYVSDRIGSYS